MKTLCGTVLAAAVAVTCAMRAESVAGGICVADGGPKWRMFDRRVGMFVHWGVYSVGGVHEQEWMRAGMTKEEYEKYPLRFTGEKFDPDAWIDAAESFGAEYIVFTAKHHDGFCMWDTALTDWKSTNTPFGRDAVGELAAACRRRGMHLGLYYSNPDWHHPNAYNPLSTHQLSAPNPGDSPDIAKYREYVKAQVTELLTRYGDICCLFWDIPPHVEDASMNELVRRLQSGIMVNNRGWSADGDYSTPERGHGDQGSSPARFCEVCDSLDADSWGYNRNARWHTPEYLRTARDNALSKGWNFLLNVGPKPDGTIPDEALAILKKLGKPAGCVLEHTATDVADPVAVAKWWVENLGFEITSQRDDATHTTFIVDKTGKIALELYRAKDAPSAPDYHSMRPLALHFGFVSDDVEADIARLTAAGATLVVHEKAPWFDGAMMKDPSGISIQFVKRARPVLTKRTEKPHLRTCEDCETRGSVSGCRGKCFTLREGKHSGCSEGRKMRTICGTILAALLPVAVCAATYKVDIDRSDGLHRCGETATFTVRVLSTNALAEAANPCAERFYSEFGAWTKGTVENEDKAYGELYGRIVERIRLWPGLAPHETESSPGRFAYDAKKKVWRRNAHFTGLSAILTL